MITKVRMQKCSSHYLIVWVLLTFIQIDAYGTERISVSSLGEQGNSGSFLSSISDDGRFVAFSSAADNLVASDTNGTGDLFVHDRISRETTRVSVSTTGEQANYGITGISISGDGRYVAFVSNADNLVDNDTNGIDDVFVHDRDTGVTKRISVSSTGQQSNRTSGRVSISSDGRYVAFSSIAANLVAGDTNDTTDVFVHDRNSGETKLVSVSSTGEQGNDGSPRPSISSDGRFVAFSSFATNLVAGDTNGQFDVFVHDQNSGETRRVSVSSTGGEGNRGSSLPKISSDGRFVTFLSAATNLVQNDTNGFKVDVFVHDRTTGETQLISVSTSGEQSNRRSNNPSISSDGRFVVFDSRANNLVDSDTNDKFDIFVHDRNSGETRRISVSSTGGESNENSHRSAISNDGCFVTFDSRSNTLVLGDANQSSDVFVNDNDALGSVCGTSSYFIPSIPYLLLDDS